MKRNPLDARVAARHSDIPQDALFTVEAEPVGKEKQRREKSVAHGTCPECGAEDVGQVRDGAGLAWRPHMRRVGKRSVHCRMSAKAVTS